LPATHNVPAPIEQPLLKRPWGRTKKRLSRFQLFQERIWVMGGGCYNYRGVNLANGQRLEMATSHRATASTN
jgi:hypothetical protein